jgi:RNA polymerase sigma factor (sigma-70 family)
MADSPLFSFIRRLHGRLQPGSEGLADAELLARFVAGGDEAAFETLVWRHGGLVLGVARRMLGRAQDVEDAFQATFLVLARKARSVARQASVGPWLYTTAYRVALRVRGRRGAGCQGLPDDLPARGPAAAEEASRRDLRAVLDEEVGRLPARFRAAVVLCYFEGLTTAEAALRLGCPRGTVNSRLAGARERLRLRLVRRGLAPAAAAGLLVPAAGQAAVGPSLAAATARAATLFVSQGAGASAAPVVVLTQGVLKAMFMSKIKTAAAVVASVALLAAGGGVCGYRAVGPAEAQARQQEGGGQDGDAGLRKQEQKLQDEMARMRKQLERQERVLRPRPTPAVRTPADPARPHAAEHLDRTPAPVGVPPKAGRTPPPLPATTLPAVGNPAPPAPAPAAAGLTLAPPAPGGFPPVPTAPIPPKSVSRDRTEERLQSLETTLRELVKEIRALRGNRAPEGSKPRGR